MRESRFQQCSLQWGEILGGQCLFDDSDRLQLVRLKDICASHAEAVERMGVLWRKYGQTYSTTEGMNHEDGRFVVGYDKDGMRLFTIATFRNCCDLSFGPF